MLLFRNISYKIILLNSFIKRLLLYKTSSTMITFHQFVALREKILIVLFLVRWSGIRVVVVYRSLRAFSRLKLSAQQRQSGQRKGKSSKLIFFQQVSRRRSRSIHFSGRCIVKYSTPGSNGIGRIILATLKSIARYRARARMKANRRRQQGRSWLSSEKTKTLTHTGARARLEQRTSADMQRRNYQRLPGSGAVTRCVCGKFPPSRIVIPPLLLHCRKGRSFVLVATPR